MNDWTDEDTYGTEVDYDLLDFDDRDVLDQHLADEHRALLTGLPERPGTLR